MSGGLDAAAAWGPASGLTGAQREAYAGFTDFAESGIRPYADSWDRQEEMPKDAVQAIGDAGYLGALVPAEHGGLGLDAVTFGLLNEALGNACSSARSLLTVHAMVTQAVGRWGRRELRDRWLPELAAGRAVGAFALTEADAGSDAGSIKTLARPVDGGYLLSGEKRWITFGQIADVYLVLARCADGLTAFLVERDSAGVDVEPVTGMLGIRASMTATLSLSECFVPAGNRIGRPDFGLTAVAGGALEWGRYSVAWGCAGLIRACLEDSVAYAAARIQFGGPIGDHQLVRGLITDMAVGTDAARGLCLQAGRLLDARHPGAVAATWSAKYFASRHAFAAAADAVQIHGANGCGPDHAVQRYLRDAKIMEIIEGSTQIQQTTIAGFALQRQKGPSR